LQETSCFTASSSGGFVDESKLIGHGSLRAPVQGSRVQRSKPEIPTLELGTLNRRFAFI
jgi:hypothetical protein